MGEALSLGVSLNTPRARPRFGQSGPELPPEPEFEPDPLDPESSEPEPPGPRLPPSSVVVGGGPGAVAGGAVVSVTSPPGVAARPSGVVTGIVRVVGPGTVSTVGAGRRHADVRGIPGIRDRERRAAEEEHRGGRDADHARAPTPARPCEPRPEPRQHGVGIAGCRCRGQQPLREHRVGGIESEVVVGHGASVTPMAAAPFSAARAACRWYFTAPSLRFIASAISRTLHCST